MIALLNLAMMTVSFCRVRDGKKRLGWERVSGSADGAKAAGLLAIALIGAIWITKNKRRPTFSTQVGG